MKQIQVGSRQYELYWLTGAVLSASKNLETKVSGGGGGGYVNQGSGYVAPVSIKSTTTVHDQLFLADKSGTEHAYQLQGFDLACRESNQVTVAWAMKPGAKQGPYVLVYNHATKKPSFNDSSLKDLFKPSKLLYWAATVAVIIAGFRLASSGNGFILMIVAIVVATSIYKYMTSTRVKQFKSSISMQEFSEA